MSLKSIKVVTKSYKDQKPGTSGLRKLAKIFQQEHYTENFIQAILTALGDMLKGCVLVVGGDGRFYCKEAVNLVIGISAANGVSKLIVGQKGILSTPAVSALIRKHGTDGGIILTASHNPGGPDKDFGIKFNTSNGGPASASVSEKIFEISSNLREYSIVPDMVVDLTVIGTTTVTVDGRSFVVDVVDPVVDYLQLMKDIFDFPLLKRLLSGDIMGEPFRILIDCMNGVTGPYVRRIFVDELGVASESAMNSVPLEDFGGIIPDPNPTSATQLFKALKENDYDFGAALDGDGDRCMILGRKAFFVNASDSLAVLADNLECIPFFQRSGVKGFARSMPTSPAVDRVAAAKDKKCFVVPAGWKFFVNLLDDGQVSLCGEESFGTGSDHIREKDGIWTVIAWLSVVAHLKRPVAEVVADHWTEYGRNFFTRHDFDTPAVDQCNKMIEELEELVTSPEFVGTTFSSSGITYVVRSGENFEYKDPVDGSVASNQGIRILFINDSSIVFRLSGTGTTGATVRVYASMYVADINRHAEDTQLVLKTLMDIALQISRLRHFTGCEKPSVII